MKKMGKKRWKGGMGWIKQWWLQSGAKDFAGPPRLYGQKTGYGDSAVTYFFRESYRSLRSGSRLPGLVGLSWQADDT